MFRKIIKYSLIGAATLSTGLSLHCNDYNINSLGIVRLGRAATTVVDVAYTYKNQLYYKKWDKNSEEYKLQKSEVHKVVAKKLLDLICVNKGVYIKVGQHIGGLEYLLPHEFVQTMKVLHSNAPENPVEDLYKVIKQDLKKNPEELFDSFDPIPLGTASLAQVHKATLKNGDVVAVKVQHPYVKGNSLVDMKTMEYLVKVMAVLFPDFKIQWLVDESKRNLPIELDFLHEGKNAEKVANQFKEFKWLKIPKIYWEVSSSRILVMEYLEGSQITDLNYVKEQKLDPFDISNKIGRLYAEMIFTNGFVHSDPHPGNILIKSTSKPGEAHIILLDHGLYADLSDHFRYNYSNLWLSILKVDRDGMKKHSMNLGINENLYGLFACMVTGRPWETVMKGIRSTKISQTEKEMLQHNSSLVLPQISDVLEQVDRQMLLILKTNDLIRGIETTLGTQNRMSAFSVMSKCCIRSSYDEIKKKKEYNSFMKLFGITLKENWEIFKINIYNFYLGLINFNLVSAIKQIV